MRRLGLVLLAVLSLFGVFGIQASASAETYVHHDTTQDVVKVSFDGDDCPRGCGGNDFPEADVLKWRAAYKGSGLTMSVVLGQVPRRGFVAYRVQAAGGASFVAVVRKAGSLLKCHVYEASDGYEHASPCNGIDVSLDKDARAFEAEIPSGLLGDATEVRVGAAAYTSRGHTFFLDDGMRDDFKLGNKLFITLGPAVARD